MQSCTVVYSYAWWWKASLHGHVCSCMFMYSHVQLYIAMHGGGRLGHTQVRTFMHSHVQLCIAMNGGRTH